MVATSSFPLAKVGMLFSTQDRPPSERRDWWREVICRHYTQVEIVSNLAADYSAETRILPLPDMQLSSVRSEAISIVKQVISPEREDQDAYFAVLLLSGAYRLRQDGREVALQPGDMAIYDATRQHRLDCFGDDFSKLIFAIPRRMLQNRFATVERCTAVRMAGNTGIGAIVSNFLRTSAHQIEGLPADELVKISHATIDMLLWNLNTIKPGRPLSPSREQALIRVKAYIEQQLRDSQLDAAMIAGKVGLSPRYINSLFATEDTSLMRYVLQRRLECCHRELSLAGQNGRVSDLAFRWGFNDLSHFSRAFKQRYGITPRQLNPPSA